MALRTQQVIAHESGISDFVDPFGGSYAIETQTKRIEAAARQYIERIDELGGMVAAIEQGYVQREIQNSAYRYQLDIEQGRRTVVGQNAFEVDEAADVPVMKIDPAVERDQVKRVKLWKSQRDKPRLERALGAVSAAAEGDANLMPLLIEAMQVGATVGEASDVLRSAWGQHQQTVIL